VVDSAISPRPARAWTAPHLVAGSLFLVLLAGTTLAWWGQVQRRRSLLEQHTEDVCEQAARSLERFAASHLRTATIFARRWVTDPDRDFSPERFHSFAAVLLDQLPGYRALGLLDGAGQSGWVEPTGTLASDLALRPEELESQTPPVAEAGVLLSSPRGPEHHRPGFHAVFPLPSNDERQEILVLDLDASAMIADALGGRLCAHFTYSVVDSDVVLGGAAECGESGPLGSSVRATRSFAVGNRTWELTLTPRPALATPATYKASAWVALLGLLVSAATGLTTLGLARRRRAGRERREREAARRALLSRRVLSAQEEEGGRLARELHDELGQLLTAIQLDFDWLRRQSTRAGVELDASDNLVEQAAEELRRICRGLRPPLLHDLGLASSVRELLREFEERSGLRVEADLSLADAAKVGTELALCAYRVLQESLTNAARHSGSDRVQVDLHRTGGRLQLRVRDEGRGFSADGQGPGTALGLAGMRERADLVGGTLEIRSAPGRGTTISFEGPVSGEEVRA
jgi:signal transduction histidine kinase